MKSGKSLNRRLLAAALAPGLLAGAIAAHAQATANGGGLEEIIVTANKRSENMQAVPIAISAITADAASRLGVVNPQNLAIAIPGLRLDRQTNGTIPFIRGVGNPSTQLGNEPSVAMYVDDVYMNNSNVAMTNYNNIDRIEVLKGPQGTLFGRNATGGVIQVFTKNPTPEKQLDLSLGYGNYDTRSGSLYASGAWSETISANLAVYREDQNEGWGDNLTTGNDSYRQDNTGGRAKILWEPSDKTSVLFNVDYDDFANQQGAYFRPAEGTRSTGGALSVPPKDIYDTFESIDPIADSEQQGASLKVSHEYSMFRLVSITAYRQSESRQYFNQTGTSTSLLNPDLIYNYETFTQELQFLSPDDSTIKWTAGMFYYDDMADLDRFRFDGAFAGGPGKYKGAYAEIESNSWAGFGQVLVPIGDATNITAGIRYTRDHREMTGGRVNDTNGVKSYLESNNSPSDDSWGAWGGKFSIDHQFTDDFMAYIAYNRGFKGGVFNSIIAPDFGSDIPRAAGNNITPPVKPEKLDAYSAGFKSEWLDNMIRVNGEAYFYKFKGLQLQQVLLIPGGGTATLLTNAAKAEVKGFDLEVTAVPNDRITLTAAATYLDAQYKDFPNGQFFAYRATPGGNCAFVQGNAGSCAALPPDHDPATGNWNLKGNDMINSPEWSVALTASYTLPTSVGDFAFSVMYSYTDTYFFDADNGLGQVAPSKQENNQQPALDIFNASVTWYSTDEKYDVRLWGKNLSDETWWSFANETGTVTKNIPGPPRTYGVTATAHF